MATVTVTGKLTASADSEPVQGSVDVMLCGYGSQVPRVNGESLVARITTIDLSAASDGTFTFVCAGNDSIVPAGTYYAITIRDENGDIAQVNAYRFIGSGSYDLGLTDPYDPNQPPPPLPPLITNLLLVVPWSETMDFPGDIYTSYRVNLTGDVTSSTASDTVQGNLYTYIIQQDSVGNHAFTWPEDFLNPSPINPAPNGFTVQTFVMGVTHLIPVGAAIWFDQ
jgi:hypothetical protein